jgi:small subunit ribosomal protein S16
MLTIRLSRVGSKNDSSFRVIVVDSKRKPQPGKYLEMVGSYDPRVDRVELKADRIKHWMSHGAQVSDTVHNLLVSQKIIDAKKINILPKFVAPEAPAVEAAPAAAEAPAEVAAAEAPIAETTEEKAEATETAAPTEENPVATEEPQA